MHQLASNFASFFDRLVDLLEELKGALPRFRDLLDILRSGESASQRLRFSIQAFYHDLLELFQAVARVFTKKTGSKLLQCSVSWLVTVEVLLTNTEYRQGSRELPS